MKYQYNLGVIKQKTLLPVLVAIGFALTLALGMALPARAGHNGAVVTTDINECEPTTISATIADPDGTHIVNNMYLVVDTEDSEEQFVNIPTNGTSVSLSVGPFHTSEDTTVSWNVFGGAERTYDQPLWNGYGTPDFGSDINEYASDVGSFSWVIAGTDDPNPFVNWNEITVAGCYPRTAAITSPTTGQDVPQGDVDFTAFLDDDDSDAVQWAVREGTCAAGTNTVFGNVDGHSDVATIDQSDLSNQTFEFTGDMSAMTPGEYCFIYNPVEDAGESNIRETVEFNLVQVPDVKGECKRGGWQSMMDHMANTFKNQGDCVSYVATDGRNLGNGN